MLITHGYVTTFFSCFWSKYDANKASMNNEKLFEGLRKIENLTLI